MTPHPIEQVLYHILPDSFVIINRTVMVARNVEGFAASIEDVGRSRWWQDNQGGP